MGNRVDWNRHTRGGTCLAVLLFLLFGQLSGSASALTKDETVTIGVYEEVASSVVNITTAACDPEFFFCSVPEGSGSGSGIILMEDGTIVTNHHVVANARSIQVVLSDGRRKEAKIVASSPENDMAIIRIDPAGAPLKPVVLGDSDRLQVGEKVLAIGNPFGLGQTLSVGVVSMTGRSIRDGGIVFRNLIQISAAINPGNSGGALVNSGGQLVGMNTAILSPTGSSVGIGFAIPVNSIKRVAPGLMNAWGRWLGWAIAAALVIWILRRIYRTG
ncbi:MAG: trypsin-like serine protease [Syntrophobacteraceae bacterium]|nr:trypsin-like serine protease [Syntrophobacteraceae bacterium]